MEADGKSAVGEGERAACNVSALAVTLMWSPFARWVLHEECHALGGSHQCWAGAEGADGVDGLPPPVALLPIERDTGVAGVAQAELAKSIVVAVESRQR